MASDPSTSQTTPPENVISFRDASPSARLKALDWNEKRARCEHKKVEVWLKEPILECRTCGAVVDPYEWIRGRVRDWKQWQDSERFRCEELKLEREKLQKELRKLRGEYRDEAERAAAEREAARAVMVLPPQRRA